MNCSTCLHNKNMKCHNPKNFQPRYRQRKMVMPLSKRFYPLKPAFCKGWRQQFQWLNWLWIADECQHPSCPETRPHWDLD